MSSRLEAVLRAGKTRCRSVCTGEFVTLSGEEAAALTAEGEIEALTFADYVASDKLPDGESYFRVRFALMKPDRTYGYKVYDARRLWDWVRIHFADPDRSKPTWREDWWELHNRYDPQGVVPNNVHRLPSLYDPQDRYEGIGNQRRKVRTEQPQGLVWAHYEGAPGQERKVRQDFPSGEVEYFEGSKGQERKVRTEFPNGLVFRYERVYHQDGQKREKRMWRADLPLSLIHI